MKKIIISVFILVLIIIVSGLFLPTIPLMIKKGFHGIGGEFCGFIYYPSCDEETIQFFTIKEALEIIKYQKDNNINL